MNVKYLTHLVNVWSLVEGDGSRRMSDDLIAEQVQGLLRCLTFHIVEVVMTPFDTHSVVQASTKQSSTQTRIREERRRPWDMSI